MGSSNPARSSDRPKPARWFYGWTIVGTLAVTETVSWGILYYAFSIFLVPMQTELGWSASATTGAYSLALLISGLVAPFVGIWIDRRGARLLMTGGSILGTLLMLAWSRVDSLFAYYAIWIGLGLAMATTLYDPAFAAVTAWFEQKRSRAILIVTLAAGFASTIFLPVTGWLEQSLGWRDALTTLAVVLGVLTIVPHALVLRRSPDDIGLHVDGMPSRELTHQTASIAGPRPMTLGDALGHTAFWWITVAFFFETLSTVAVGTHLIPYLVDRGEKTEYAAAIVGLIGAAQVASRIVATMVGSRVSAASLTALIFALQACAIAVLLQWQTHVGLIVAVLLLGAGRGAVTLMRAGLVADLFGRPNYGAISGKLSLFLTGAKSLAPVGAGIAYSFWGDYRPVFWTLAGISLIGAVAMLGVRSVREPVEIVPRTA